MKKVSGKLDGKNISVRCSVREREKIEKAVEEKEVTMSEFVKDCIWKTMRKEKQDMRKEQKIATCVVDLQNAINYIKEHYGEDKYLDEIGDRIWERL